MYQNETLSNGLRVISHSMPDRSSIGLGFLVGTGGRYEPDECKGAAHFLEHILFKGTKKYTCDAIKEQIEGVGGSLNAFTTEELTCFFAKIPSRHFEKTFDILSDMVFHPQITKVDVQKEASVIMEEIKMYQDLPQYYVMELLDDLIWPNHPLGKTLIGTPETISNMTNVSLKQYHKNQYSLNNIVISACGRLQHKSLAALVKRKIKQSDNSLHNAFLPVEDTQFHPKLKFFDKQTEQMHVAFGMRGLNNDHPDRYALSLFNIILGGNMSSRLFNEVREKRGLAYSISSGVKFMRDTGIFLIRAGVDKQKLTQAVEVILKELEKICKRGITTGELTRAREYYIGQLTLGLEDSLDHMLWMGEDVLLLDRPRQLKGVIKQVNKVICSDIKRIAQLVLNKSRLNMAIVGSVSKAQKKDLRTLMGVKLQDQ